MKVSHTNRANFISKIGSDLIVEFREYRDADSR